MVDVPVLIGEVVPDAPPLAPQLAQMLCRGPFAVAALTPALDELRGLIPHPDNHAEEPTNHDSGEEFAVRGKKPERYRQWR